MTSLSRQLDTLRTATSSQLTVEKQHVSLLFEKREAAKLDRETIHEIGITGLNALKKLDPVFEEASDLFDEANINFQRVLISKEENEVLNKKLEKIIFLLSPYMQHFACQQALELLVYRYQIYAFNAETLLMAFLPFHETNFFGRIVSIVHINFETDREWGFLQEFAKKQSPVPFRMLLTYALSSTHSLLGRVHAHVEQLVKLVGEDWLETHAPLIFTFCAKLMLGVLEDATAINDQLLGKVIPLVANGLKSRLPSLRSTALMVICKLAVSVKLTDNVVTSLIKIVMIKVRDVSLSSALSTVVVICQQQQVNELCKKGLLKLIRRDKEIGFWNCVRQLGTQTDLTYFLEPLWNTLMGCMESEDDAPTAQEGLLSSLDLVKTGEQAALAFQTVLQLFSKEVDLQKKITKEMRSIGARFPSDFDTIRDEWEKKEGDVFTKFVEKCSLQDLLLQHDKEDAKKGVEETAPASSSDDVVPVSVSKELAIDIARRLAAESELAKRKIFNGDPLKKALEWIEGEKWEEVAWALEEMTKRKSYIASKLEEDVEEFVVELTKHAVSQTKGIPLSQIRDALAEAPLSSEFIVSMLTRQEDKGSGKKKSRKDSEQSGGSMETFKGEGNAEWERRLTFSLELLNVKNEIPVSGKMFSLLFDIVKQVDNENDKAQLFFVQQLAITLLIKVIRNPGSYKVSSKDLQMECVVDTLRSTHSHHVLREALRLLTVAVKLAPGSVTAHVMSVFTFMGSGLLKKDNDLTLGIIEDTLYAMFHALVIDQDGKGVAAVGDMRRRLIDVTRVFAASASDIPAHRRGRMAVAIGKAIGCENAWIVAGVLLEGYCSKWQRGGGGAQTADVRAKTALEQDAYEDLVLEMCAHFSPVEQLSCVLDILSFVIRLGGDSPIVPNKSSKSSPLAILDPLIFDRSKYTLPKLRHFRFVVVGVAVKILSNRSLYMKLSSEDDESLYESMLPVGKRLMMTSVDLDEFVQKETDIAEKSLDKSGSGETTQAHRYWVALGTRSETVSEKLRHLLPGSTAARLIALILEDSTVGYAMREKALALCNTKLLHDGFFQSVSGIREQQLSALAEILNQWIGPETVKEKVILCQNAAFTLKLIAKRLPTDANSKILAKTMELCTKTAAEWTSIDEAMTGNVLLLAGELIRSHNMGTTMLSAEPLLNNCMAILTESTNQHKDAASEQKAREEAVNKRQRMRQISLSGRPRGSDTLVICSLTCVQRILDQFAPFVAPSVGAIMVHYCRLMARFSDPEKEKEINAQLALGVQLGQTNQMAQANKHTIQYRLSLIRRALIGVELRLLSEHVTFAVQELKREEKPLCSLFSLISSYYETKNQYWVNKVKEQMLTSVYLPALEYRTWERKPEAFETVSTVEGCVFDSLIAMADVLTENQLRPVINQLVEWAETGLFPNADHNTKLRLVVLLHFANRFYDAFNSLALPYYGRLVEICGKVLRQCNASTIGDSSLLLSGKKDTVEALETNFALTNAIDLINNCAKHRAFFTEDRASLVSDVLVCELDNTKTIGHESRCVPHLADAIYNISEGHPPIFVQMLNDILIKTRSNRPKIRYRVLLVIERLFDRIGDSIAPQLPMVMPFLSELLEDENKNVEEQCDRVVRLLQRKFGEDISEGFA